MTNLSHVTLSPIARKTQPVNTRRVYSHVSLPPVIRKTSFTHERSVYLSEASLLALTKTRKAPVKKKYARIYKKKLALLLPAHNEELIIQSTIRSSIAAGQAKENIFVVDDCSSDKTRAKAVELLGKKQVLTVERSGKAGAVYKAIKHFDIEDRYQWIHVADSDSIFGKDYFKIYRAALKGKQYVAAVGFVQSLRGNWISKYRVFSYTYGQQVLRRFQSKTGMISVFPGPVTSFRTDILPKIDFAADSLTEDFDITLQFHRMKLGKIRYIPRAVNFTQDPQNLRDFCKQTARWHRGFFQGVSKYKIGRHTQPIDMYIGYQLLETTIYLFQMLVLLPIVIATSHPHRWTAIPIVMLSDYLVICFISIFTALAAKRVSILSVVPAFYFMRMLELGIFVMAFFEVIVLRRFKQQIIGWQTEGRRYSLDSNALQDAAS